MPKGSTGTNQTTIIALFALLGAIVLGLLFFLSDLGDFIRDTGR